MSHAAALPIPTGTVTLLFTDVEGSTRLWEAEPEAMAPALRRHDEMLRAAIGRAGGFVFKTVGDAFCAAFATPQAALDAVLAAQRELAAEPWPTGRPIRVRMSLHTGVCEERDNDYFGPVVNRAARLEAVAHGGQVLVSGATAELLSEALPGGVRLRDLGPHRLKDLGRPEQVFQLEADYLPSGFPVLGTLDNPELPNNLPCLLSAFVGREREVGEVRSLAGSSRLVTLTGSGGCGKTRLALQAAAELLDGAGDGVWFVELAPLAEAEKIPEAVAAVLGLADRGGQPLLDSLTDTLREQDTLILLDNCEHLIDGAAKFCGQLVRDCPRLRILATSREPLGLDGEHVYRVPSLSLPPAEAEAVDDIAAADAVRLFVDRAGAHAGGFDLDESSAPLVASVCRRLDGIPLALELAAARLSSMSIRQVSERLDQRFRLLTGGSRNAMPRQQTLQAAVDWSFGLLTQAEREVLRRLSVFAGGFELEAAEVICAAGSVDAVDAFDVLDLLGSLVSKSLVVADRADGSVRYRMLETIRQYAARELLRSGGEREVMAARDRHAGHFLRLAEEAAPALAGPGQGDWLRRLDVEWENLRAAAAHLAAEGRAEDVLRLGVGLRGFAISRGHTDVLAWLRDAVDPAAGRPSALLANALVSIGLLTTTLLRMDADAHAMSGQCGERALAMARQLGDRRVEARALLVLAGAAYFRHDRDRMRRLGREGVAIAREIGDVHLRGELLPCLAIGASDDESRRVRLEALECFRQAGDEQYAANEMHMLYGLDVMAGRLDDARAYITEAIATAERLGASTFLNFMQTDYAILLLIEGRHEEAAPLVRGCLLAARRMGLVLDVSELLFVAAGCIARQGDHARAARLHGAANREMGAAIELGSIMWSDPEEQLREREQGSLRELMGAEAYDAGFRAGARLSRSQAVELALGRAVPA